LGVGGGFLMVPAMIYVLDMPTALVPGTSLFQIVFVAAAVTIQQSVENGTVDIVLALILVLGGVAGVHAGLRVGRHLKGEYFRALLGVLVLAAAVKLAADLTITPRDLYSLELRAP
ncbi:MAG: TSUP family transporter, partial [Stellaceae bacterium]